MTAKAQRVARLAAKGHQFDCARIFYLKPPNDERLREVVMLKTSGDMVWLDADYENQVSFRPPAKASEINQWSSPRLYDWLLKQWQNPDSELKFASKWLGWSEEKRRDWLYNGSGGLNELVQVMKWALQSDPQIQDGQTWSWHLEEGSQDRFRNEDDQSHRDIDIRHFSPQLWALREFFIANFFPLPELPMAKPSLCVQEFDRLHRSHIVARVKKRTAHERLEADSKLRQWLRGKVSDAEAARPLPL